MRRKSFAITIILLSIIMILIFPSTINANTVEYRGEAEGLIITTDDFFASFGELMPGDKKEGKALIKNKTNDKIEVFFKTEELFTNDNYDEIDNSLLQKINLTIKLKTKKEEKNIYEGNLEAKSISKEYISLGEYEKNFDGEFLFQIDIPNDLKNAYSLSKTEVKWVFYVVKEQDKNNSDINNSDINSNIAVNTKDKENEDSQNNKTIIENIKDNVKTGDYIYGVILIVILIIFINVLVELRRKNKNEK